MEPEGGLPAARRRSTPNFESGRRGLRPLAVVVHTTQGTAEEAIHWFGRLEAGTSSHYLVGLDGSLTQLVDEEDIARHAGRVLRPSSRLVIEEGGDPNAYTIGIEFEDAGDPLGVARTDAQYRTGAGLIARISRRWGIPIDAEHVIGHREVFAAKECPGNLDKARLIADAARIVAVESASAPAPGSIACLVPVRNAAADLPGFLEAAAGFADWVLALDDGSTDDSAEILRRSPLVEALLRNPRRETFAGWDDHRNRQRLLGAAAELEPAWIVFLDADERLDPEDGAVLREFLRSDAIAGCAYGLRLYREWGEGRVAERFTWVYRAFAFAPGQSLPQRRLHFNPIPGSVPRSAWLRTTVRARHLDSPKRMAARIAKYRDADPEGDHAELSPRLLEPPEGPVRAWERRPAGLPVLDPDLHLAGAPATPFRTSPGPRLVCLLPARNAAADMPGYLESAARFADAVIALDDGSTDGTAEALERSAIVRTLVRNPKRPDYRGWDDAANRQRLLDAAVDLGADWALFLDADERIDPGDARALRAFVDQQADPRCAYGFRVHRMIGDESHYDRADLWVYRLFAPAAGQRLPARRLHLVPIPTSIPRARWRRTTVRIQHLAGLTEERRAARLAKYEAADPGLEWQSDYSGVAAAPEEARPWRPRPPDLPVVAETGVAGSRGVVDLETIDLDAPVLSAIVIAREDERTIASSVRSVVEQDCPEPFEVIVVVSGSEATARIVRERFPEVRLVELPEPVLPGDARNAGLRVATGDYVSFPGSHVELLPGSLVSRVRAHERGYAMVTGSIVNGTPTRSGWASYFLDHSSALPGRPSGELEGAPSHCSYVREFLVEVGGFPEGVRAGEDTVVNQELWRRGHRAFREREIRLVHRSPCRDPLTLVRHHFRRGRAFGRLLRAGRPGAAGRPPRRSIASYLRRYPWVRLRDTDQRVARWGAGLQDRYAGVRPLVLFGVVAAWAGAFVELALPGEGRRPSGIREELRQRDEGQPPGAQPVDDPLERIDGGVPASAAVVHDHD